MRKILYLSLILCLFAVSCFAQEMRRPDFPKGSTEDIIVNYFKIFNSGDESKMTEFIKENSSAESLKRRPAEDQLQFYKRLRDEMKTVSIKRFMKAGENEINVLVEAQSGESANFNFRFEPQTPHKISGMRIEKIMGGNGDEPLPPPNEKSVPLTEKEFVSEVNKIVEDSQKKDEFSGVVLVAKKDKEIFTKAVGLANKEKNISNLADTKFNLGSLNKSFTQIAIGQLIENGKISFDDKLGKYLPDYPNKDAREKITIRHLLTMSSGVGDIFGEKFRTTPKNKIRSINDYIPLFSETPLAFEPGTSNQYSNGGYILLGAIIEKATGQSYYDYVRTNIFEPLGMKNTEFYESDKATPNLAEGYTNRGEKTPEKSARRNNLDTRPAKGSSAGGGYSTAEDLLKFSLALQTGKIKIPDETPARKDADGKFIEMQVGGGAPGINSSVMIKDGFTVIVLSNYDPPSAENVSRKIGGYLMRFRQ